MHIALPRWTAMLIFCLRKETDRGSPVTAWRRRPTSETKLLASGPQGPIVSSAIGTKILSFPRQEYFCVFFFSAVIAGRPACDVALGTWDLAMVLTQVTSQTKHFPCFQGISVAPPGRFPSSRHIPAGSRCEGTPAALKAR